MKKGKKIMARALSISLCLGLIAGSGTASAKSTDSETGRLPTMGWSSWNLYMKNINEQKIKSQASALVSTGLNEKGYQYVVVDDGCLMATRDSNGKLQPDLAKFPNGFQTLGNYIHGLNLKFGMYNVGGTMTCTKLAGSYNHEFTDAKTYSEWGTDFLKYDFCNNPLVKMPLDPTTGESVNTSFQETVLDTMAKEAPVVRKIVVKKMKDGVATEIKTVEIGSSNTTISDGAQLDFGYGADTPCLGMLDSNDNFTKRGSGTLAFSMSASEMEPEAKYLVDVYCVNGDKTRLLSMKVNEGTANYPYFYLQSEKTAGWSVADAQARTLQNVPLVEGENSIEFYLDKGDAHRSYQQDAARSFQAISVAFDAVPRNIVLNVCEWGWTHPYEGWGADVGHSWRTTTDITTSAGSVWWNNHPQGQSIMQIYEKNVILDEYAGPYGYNDADMLAVGLSGIDAEQNKSHFSLWCMMAAPLITGADLTNASQQTLSILGNEKAIALDQDDLCLQAKRFKQENNKDYLVKPLADGSVAVCMFNKAATAQNGSLTMSEIVAATTVKATGNGTAHLTQVQKAMFTDTFANAVDYTTEEIWSNEMSSVAADGSLTSNIPAYGVRVYKIAPAV